MECKIDECLSKVLARGWCSKHYNHWRKWGDPLGGRPAPSACKEEGCSRNTVGQGWCERHYDKFVRQPARRLAREQAKRDQVCANRNCERSFTPRTGRSAFCCRACKELERIADGRARDANIKSYYSRKYGLTAEEVATLRAQGCQICGSPGGVGRHGQLHIDHCHDSGKVRGALCSACNTGIGQFQHDPELLQKAIEYLQR